jgi:glycosyltransferase involved in cell wall biosynthesis
MTAEAPLISIITPCLNAAAFVGEAIESVRSQSGPAIEHIVLYGGSSDGTRNILARFSHLRVIEGADEGSHDAMNRGLDLARGQIIGFINADDCYAPRVLSAVVERFAAEPELDAVLGLSYIVARSESEWRTIGRHPLCRNGGFDLGDLMYGIPCFNARFYRKRVFDHFGRFALHFSFAADRDFLLRLALAGCKGRVLHRPCYFYRSHDGSRTLNMVHRNADAITQEHLAIATWLLAQDVPPAVRRALRAWRAYETFRAALRAGQLGIGSAPLADLLRGVGGKLRTMAYRGRIGSGRKVAGATTGEPQAKAISVMD